nr:zf-CCHC domain-containing protein/UBN2 domain-containing protein [Tanacetum cinerariifolium]
MFTRSIVIQRRVEDLQLGVESYQKKLNLTKPDTYHSDLKRKEAYIAYSNPRGFIYQNKDKKNRKSDKDRAAAMIQAIDKRLKTRRIMRSLERYDKRSKSKYIGIVPTEMELILEHTQQGISHEVSVTSTKPGRMTKPYSSYRFIAKCFNAGNLKMEVKRANVTANEESKDLSSLALDELIGNLKVHEVVMEKDSKIYKGKKKRINSIALKAKKESSDDETLTSRSNDEQYAMTKGKSDQKCFRCNDPSHLIGDFPKTSRNKDQKAFIGGSWSDRENDAEDKINDETCLMAQSSNEDLIAIKRQQAELKPRVSLDRPLKNGRTDPPLKGTDPPYQDPKKLKHNSIDESKKPSLKPSLKSGIGYVKTESG